MGVENGDVNSGHCCMNSPTGYESSVTIHIIIIAIDITMKVYVRGIIIK